MDIFYGLFHFLLKAEKDLKIGFDAKKRKVR